LTISPSQQFVSPLAVIYVVLPEGQAVIIIEELNPSNAFVGHSKPPFRINIPIINAATPTQSSHIKNGTADDISTYHILKINAGTCYSK
jgi:hypothetical protein